MLSFEITTVLLILRRPEIAAIQTTLEQLRKGARDWEPIDNEKRERHDRTTEGYAFLGVLPHLPADSAFDQVVNRPVEALDLLRLENWFLPLPTREIQDALAQLHSTRTPKALMRILWFLGASKPTLSIKDIDHIVALANSEDWVVRAAAMQFACETGHEELGRRIVLLARAYRDTKPWWEMHWGAVLTIKFSSELPFHEVIQRLHPATAGFVLKTRGNDPDEVRLYADLIDRGWERIVNAADSNRVTSLPRLRAERENDELPSPHLGPDPQRSTSLTLRAASESWRAPKPRPGIREFMDRLSSEGDADRIREWEERTRAVEEAWGSDAFEWYGRQFNRNALREIYRQRPDYVKKWVDALSGNTRLAGALRVRLETFYVQLCPVLFEFDPALGFTLWNALHESRDGAVIFDDEGMAFKAPDCLETTKARNEMIRNAWDDWSFAQIAFLAEKYGRHDWMKGVIGELLQSTHL